MQVRNPPASSGPQFSSETPAPVIAPERSPVSTPVEEREISRTDDGDHDRFSHYCRKEDIVRATVTGEAVTALCGKKWVPSRDPERYPVCPTCKERKAAGWNL